MSLCHFISFCSCLSLDFQFEACLHGSSWRLCVCVWWRPLCVNLTSGTWLCLSLVIPSYWSVLCGIDDDSWSGDWSRFLSSRSEHLLLSVYVSFPPETLLEQAGGQIWRRRPSWRLGRKTFETNWRVGRKTRPLVLFLSVVFEPTVANYYSHRLTKTDSHSHVRKTGTKTAENQYKILTAFGR